VGAETGLLQLWAPNTFFGGGSTLARLVVVYMIGFGAFLPMSLPRTIDARGAARLPPPRRAPRETYALTRVEGEVGLDVRQEALFGFRRINFGNAASKP